MVTGAAWWERGEGKNLGERERWGKMKILGRETCLLGFFFFFFNKCWLIRVGLTIQILDKIFKIYEHVSR
jgi:hypothetical protein